jgi:DNA modification methylase
VRWLLQLHAGLVLDVFSGSGTTREAALSLGLDVVSVDLSLEAVALTARRQAQLPLSGNGGAEPETQNAGLL